MPNNSMPVEDRNSPRRRSEGPADTRHESKRPMARLSRAASGVVLVAGLSLYGCLPTPADPPESQAELEAEAASSAQPAASSVPERINLDALGRLPAFSHATRVGDQIFVSGTLGTRPQSIDLVEGGVGPETAQTMANIEQILQGAGSTLEHLAKCIVYLVDMDDFATMNEAWLEAVGPSPPARATIGVNELALGARVEIECTAVRAGV